MSASNLQKKAMHFLARRNAAPGIGVYLRHDWHRQVSFLVVYAVIVLALCFVNRPLFATIVAAFYVGRTVRDVQWWRAMAREWPTTTHFVDWQKVEAIANNQAKDDDS